MTTARPPGAIRQERDWPPGLDHRDPPPTAPGGAVMVAVLDRPRETLTGNLAGLTEHQMRRRPPSKLSLLSLIKHEPTVEIVLFQHRFAGAPLPGLTLPIDWAASWRLAPEDTRETVLAGYAAAVAASRRLTGPSPDLTQAARDPGDQPGMTLRWIMLHLIEESGRHLGHADLIRDAIEREAAA